MTQSIEPFTNLLDYLDWRGDLKISNEAPLNVIDYMIFARFSYLDFGTISKKLGAKDRYSIREICAIAKTLPDANFVVLDDRTLAEKLERGVRFSELRVSDIQVHLEQKHEKQFTAISVHLSDDELFVVFTGTDDTLFGWKEDFNMSFMSEIPSQSEALEYLENILQKYPKHKLHLCGHSKGGNLAMFSALSTKLEAKKRIADIKSFDGPGFMSPEIYQQDRTMLQKITSYFPQESIIGRLFEHRENYLVVKSAETGFLQHDLYSWVVKGTQLTVIDDTKQVNYVFNKSLQSWLQNCTPRQRELFVNSVYESLLVADYDTFTKIRTNPLRLIPTFFSSYRDKIPAKDRSEIRKMLKSFLGEYMRIRRENDREIAKANKLAHKHNNAIRRAKNKAAVKAGKTIRKRFS